MKICFISHSSKLGGAERVLLETIDAVKARGAECCVLVPGQGVLIDELSLRGIPFAIVRGASIISWGKPSLWERAKAAFRILATVVPTVRQIRQWKCDLVYSNTLAVCHGSIAATIVNIPHVWHLHEFGKEDHGVDFYFGERFSIGLVSRFSDRLIVVSNALARKYERFVDPSKLTVIYPSMDLAMNKRPAGLTPEHESIFSNGRYRGVIVGGLCEGKKQEDALQALVLLKHTGVMMQLAVVGAGYAEYPQRLDEIVRTHDLQTQVIFTGAVKEAVPVIADSDVLLVCSKCEAFGRVAVEAMFAGKPVIGSASGATPELVRDGYNGFLYKAGDVSDLATKIGYLYANPVVARRLGENGKMWAREVFTKERYGTELLAVLNSVHDVAAPQSQRNPS